MVRKAAERMAINTPLQGTAADLIKRAMVQIATHISGRQEEIRLILQVHDELIFEIRQDKVKTYAPEIKRLMAEALEMKVPVVVEESIGNNWGDLK
jgi:DNA polymerase I